MPKNNDTLFERTVATKNKIIRTAVIFFNGEWHVDIREMAVKGNETIFTPRGVRLDLANIGSMILSLQDARERIVSAGLTVNKADAGGPTQGESELTQDEVKDR